MRLFASALLLLLACAPRQQTPAATLAVRDAEVYAEVLDSLFARPGIKRIAQLVVDDSAYNHPQKRLIPIIIGDFYSFPYVDSMTVRNFEERNEHSLVLPHIEPLRSGIPVILVRRSELYSLPHGIEPYWRKFYELYPKSAGIISLSPIGYSASGDVAILMVDQGCGGLCGNGYSVGLRRKDGKWYITKIRRDWVS